MNKLNDLKLVGEAPEWMNEESYKTVCGGYLLLEETPRQMYMRVANAAASYYKNSNELKEKFFNIMWNNWLCPASPVLSNMGTNRGLPISCNTVHVGDSVDSIFMKNYELAVLSKNGAGVGIYFGDIRGRGIPIKGNGFSEGVIPWAKVFDITTLSVNQGSTRRGASAIYLPIEHLDIQEFINIRRPIGDINRRCLNIHHGVCISDEWMNSMLEGDQEKRNLWIEILKARVETGEPYLFFSDNVNKNNPECYVKNNLTVKSSNICCLSGDTIVITNSGPQRIDSLVGKEVEIYDGLNWTKTDSFKLQGYDSLTRIHLADGSFVDSNDNHRWFVANNYTHIRNNSYKENYTKDLKVGQYIEYHNLECHGNISIKGAYIKGFLCGDGTHSDNAVLNLHFPKFMCEKAILESGNEIIPSLPNTNAKVILQFSDVKEYINSGSYGRQVYKSLEGLSVRKELYPWATEYKQSLPKDILNWDRVSKIKFLSGLLDADGTISKNTIQISSIFKSFIDDLSALLKTLGIKASIDMCNTVSNNMNRITISATDAFKFKDELCCNRLNLDIKPPNRRLTTFRKIVKIEKLSGLHPVYCPTITSTGKFALANGLMTGNSEITLYTDPDHSFVCCLSSLNLVRWNEWKDTDTVNLAVRFLDAVLSEYIKKTENIKGMEASRNSAIKGRAIGIGVLGWHTMLQENNLPFESFDTMQLNADIFRNINKKANEETALLAQELGEPEWCEGFNRRNTHLIAIAPTVSNSTISGGYSAGIEPISANVFTQKSAKGTFIRKNPTLEKLLKSKKMNTPEVWNSINEQNGSVQHLTCLTSHEKEVFLTAREINQHAIVKLAVQRQRWVDQAQSVNLFFAMNSSPKYIHDVHAAAWKSGLKTLYYLRSDGVIKSDLASRGENDCKACES